MVLDPAMDGMRAIPNVAQILLTTGCKKEFLSFIRKQF